MLGGFPYSWDGRQAGAVLPALRRRAGCRLWPVVLTLLYAVSIVVPMSFIFGGLLVFDFDGYTSATSVQLVRSAEAMISVYLCVHVLVGRHDGASLVSHVDLHFPEYAKRKRMLVLDKKVAVLVFSHFFYLVMVMQSLVLAILSASDTGSLCTWIISVVYFLYTITLAFVQEISSYIFSRLLNRVLTDTLRNIQGQTDEPGSITKVEAGSHKTHGITSVKPATTPRAEAGSSDANGHGKEAALATIFRLHSPRHAQDKVSPTDEQELSRDEIMAAYKRVYRAYECQLLMSKYFGPPALGHMSLALIWLIVDLYYFMINRMDWLAVLVWAIHILHSSTKIAVFCWPAEAIKEKVSGYY